MLDPFLQRGQGNVSDNRDLFTSRHAGMGDSGFKKVSPGTIKHYIREGLLLELAKIKRIRPANREVITTEISKRQRTILETLGVCA